MSHLKTVCLIGFGEVGQTLATDLSAAGVSVITVFDTAFGDPTSEPSVAASKESVITFRTAEEAVAEADLVMSAVTAAETVPAAKSVTSGIKKGALYLDMNSASPGTKQEASALIEAVGARYVEAAVMSPIHPKRIAVPLLIGGPHMEAFLRAVKGLGFNAHMGSETIGTASATKMCRSVMIKGVEALVAESLLAARHYGVDETVLASLSNLLPADDWTELARYMLSRSLEHGARRAEEMVEVAKTVAEAGIEPHMSQATSLRQEWAAQFAEAADTPSLTAMLDHILKYKSDDI